MNGFPIFKQDDAQKSSLLLYPGPFSDSSVRLDFLLHRIADGGENPFISNLLSIWSTPAVVEVAGGFHLFIFRTPAKFISNTKD